PGRVDAPARARGVDGSDTGCDAAGSGGGLAHHGEVHGAGCHPGRGGAARGPRGGRGIRNPRSDGDTRPDARTATQGDRGRAARRAQGEGGRGARGAGTATPGRPHPEGGRVGRHAHRARHHRRVVQAPMTEQMPETQTPESQTAEAQTPETRKLSRRTRILLVVGGAIVLVLALVAGLLIAKTVNDQAAAEELRSARASAADAEASLDDAV